MSTRRPKRKCGRPARFAPKANANTSPHDSSSEEEGAPTPKSNADNIQLILASLQDLKAQLPGRSEANTSAADRASSPTAHAYPDTALPPHASSDEQATPAKKAKKRRKSCPKGRRRRVNHKSSSDSQSSSDVSDGGDDEVSDSSSDGDFEKPTTVYGSTIGAAVSQKVRQKILRHKFVEISSLLPRKSTAARVHR